MVYESPIVIANASPARFGGDPDTLPDLTAGGLVSALSLYLEPHKLEDPTLWICAAAEGEIEQVDEELRIPYMGKRFQFIMRKPIIPATAYDGYYTRFSNGRLWRDKHITNEGIVNSKTFPKETETTHKDFQYYSIVNNWFANAAREENVERRRPVWVHDYHQLHFPLYYRFAEQAASVKDRTRIGFTSHIPVMNPDIPEARRVLEKYKREYASLFGGVLHSDLISFHITEYVENFRKVLEHVLPKGSFSISEEGDLCRIRYLGNECRVGAFPIGVNITRILDGARSTEAYTRPDLFEKTEEAKRKGADVLISLGRLDYTKGDYEALEAVEEMLERGRRIFFLNVAKLSREDAPGYAELRRMIYEKVKQINAKFGPKLGYDPVYIDTDGVDYPDNLRLMQEGTLFNSSLSDGMLLVPPEGILACSHLPMESRNPIIIPQHCGYRHVMSDVREEDGNIVIDPPNTVETAEKIMWAIDNRVVPTDRYIGIVKDRMDVARWGEDFLSVLYAE
jgi:trehalose-6-phosphate synthase